MHTPPELTALLAEHGVALEQWEASVRHARSPSGASVFHGARVMLEQASPSLVRALFAFFQRPWDERLERSLTAARADGIALIAGWELHNTPSVKLYLNASERSEPARKALWSRTAWPDTSALPFAPHLLALNENAQERRWKAYLQHQDPALLHAGPRALALVQNAIDLGIYAGSVRSWDLNDRGNARQRAFFVGVSAGKPQAVATLLATLDGWDARQVATALPFTAGACRSVGFETKDLNEAPSHWTVYFKPRGLGAPLHALEPLVRFRAGAVVVAIYSAPAGRSRAFATTEHRALEYRVHAGTPESAELQPLLAWVHARVLQAEKQRTSVETALEAPPAPWSLFR